MKNLELLKEEYVEFMKRFDEINMRIAEAVDKDKEYKRYPRFHDKDDLTYVYSLHDYDYYELRGDNNMELLDVSDEDYKKSIEEAVQLRNSLFEEKHKLRLEFDVWKYKNNFEDLFSYKERHELYEPFAAKWRGWDSSDYVYDAMIHSINLTDRDEINKIISNMKKVTDMIIKYDEEHEEQWGIDYETIEFIEYLDIVNNHTRFRLNEECNTVMALDIMENHYVYEPFEESFKDCVCNVCKLVDGEFRSMLWRMEHYGHELE